MLKSSDFTFNHNTEDLSEYLGENMTIDIIQNMERMDFDELVEFKRSLEIISKVLKCSYH